MKVQAHLVLLGLTVQDKVTGFKGIVTAVSFDLYGCIEILITPEAKGDGTYPGSQWLYVNRLEVIGQDPVMAMPDFDSGYEG